MALGDGGGKPKSDLDLANEAFLKGDYKDALAKFVGFASRQPNDQDIKLAIAACHIRLGDAKAASQVIRDAKPTAPEDWAFCALVHAKADEFVAAQGAMANVTDKDAAADVELLEAMALAAAKQGDRPAAWRYYRLIQKHDPASPAIDRLAASKQFSFTGEWFGTGLGSLQNYAKGFGGGVVDWSEDTARGLWEIIRHPIRTVKQAADGIREVLSPDNLKLLLSPKELASAVGDVAARLYWSAWESCKLSVVREHGLDAEKYEDQQTIHEIAAGRMIGYVAPDLVLLVVSGGAGAAAKLPKAEKVAKAAKTVAQTEQRLEKVNQIARSAKFLADAEKYPKLRAIHWLSEGTWEALKASPRTAPRLEQVVEWMSAVRHVPGGEALVKTIAGRLHLDDVEGYIFQLSRAASYAKEEKLAEIGTRFRVAVPLPGKPVKIMLGDADLALKDGILVEVKHRKAALALDDKLNTQLLKYDRAVAEGQFKKVRIECNGPVSQQVKDRCKVIADRGTPFEVIENAPLGP
jgi:tetratricopeptide (TPR) repeat protein